jgi:predicted site-specific integrase-resolvase
MENRMYLTPKQLATRWHVSDKTLERWRHDGTGPLFIKIVGRILYPVQHIEAHEAKRIRLATSRSLPVDTDLTVADHPMVSP